MNALNRTSVDMQGSIYSAGITQDACQDTIGTLQWFHASWAPDLSTMSVSQVWLADLPLPAL